MDFIRIFCLNLKVFFRENSLEIPGNFLFGKILSERFPFKIDRLMLKIKLKMIILLN